MMRLRNTGLQLFLFLFDEGLTNFAMSNMVDGHTAAVDAVGGIEWEIKPKLFTKKEKKDFLYTALK
jgi:hypothetical protein